MAERAQHAPGAVQSMALAAACIFGWRALHGTELELGGYAFAFVGAVAGAKACAALSARAHEVFTLLKATRRHSAHGGTAQFMSLKEVRKAGHHKPGGYVVGTKDGELISDKKSVHGVAFAPPGAQKTIGPVAINAALAAASGEYDLVIVSDPKPEIGAMLKPFCERRGIGFHALNPGGRFPEAFGPRAHFNPCDLVIHAAQNQPHTLLDDCFELNTQLVQITDKADDKNIWWKRGAVSRITLVQAYWALCCPEKCNYPQIITMLEDPVAFEHLLDEIAARDDLLDGDLSRKAKSIISLSLSDPKNHASMMDEATSALRMFTPSGGVARISKTSTINLGAASKKKPLVVTLSCDMTNIKTQKQLIGLNILALSRMAVRMNKPLKVKVIYDEAAFAPLENLNDMLVIGRGLGISFELYYQTEADAKRVLGQDGFAAMMGNCDRKVWFGLNDPQAAEAVSKSLGEVSALKETYRGESDAMAVNRSHERRRLLTADQVRRLPRGMQIVMMGNEKPLVCETLNYFEVSPLHKQMGCSPWHSSKLKQKIRVWLKL